MRLKLFIILLCFYTLIFSQEKFSKEFNFTTDNDLYISSVKDRYYTNGLNLKYSYTTRNIRKLYKKIVEFQIGQQIFTPYKSTITNLNLHDRPFAGYLNVSIGIINVYKNKVILKNKIQFGIVGENAFGKELQK